MFGNTYLHQTFTEYMSYQYTHFDILIIDMPDVTASYGRPLIFIAFVGHFHTLLLTICVSSPNFHRLCN